MTSVPPIPFSRPSCSVKVCFPRSCLNGAHRSEVVVGLGIRAGNGSEDVRKELTHHVYTQELLTRFRFISSHVTS